MSSTHSVAKAVAFIRDCKGKIFYALFEKTFESNVFPQTPHWGAIFFGTAEACMERIIRSASACEGGMLKEQGGNVSPSAYIKHWRAAMAQPVRVAVSQISAAVGAGLYQVAPDKIEAIQPLLAKHQHGGVIGNRLSLDLYHHAELFAEIVATGIAPWRFFEYASLASNDLDERAGYAPAPSLALVPPLRIWKAHQESRHEAEFWVERDGRMTSTGWEYSTIGNLITTVALESEQARPGSAEATIRQLRAAVKAASTIAETQVVRIVRDRAAAEGWHRDVFKTLSGKLSTSYEQTEVFARSGIIQTTFGEILEAKALYELRSLPDVMVEWSTPLEAQSPKAYVHQDELFEQAA